MRRTGISIIGDVPWGTHFCQFYQDKQDLIDILVPYFKAGLENNEFCMWVTSEPLRAEEAKAALADEVDLESSIRKGQLEILDYSEWYTAGGKFESDRVLRGWVDQLAVATERGFDGLRLTGNTFWLETSDWRDFTEYEATVDAIIGQYRMLAICTYSLARCSAVEIMDVVSNHAFALIKRAGKWEIIESAERKKVEANLRESEEQMRMAAASTGLGTWDFDPQSGRLMGSNLYRRHFGLSPDAEVDYDKLIRALHPDDRDRVHQTAQNALRPESGGQYSTEYRTIGIEDGQERWISAMGRAFFDREGRPVRFIGTTVDATERKQAEEELRRSREWLRVTLTSIGDAVLATDTNGLVTFLNPVAARLTGWAREAALGRPVPDIFKTIDETTRQEAEDIVRRVLREGRVVSIANHSALVTRDGREVPIEDSAAPIRDAAGNIAGVVVVFHDVTEKRRAQETLRRMSQFPQENPNPVLRIAADGALMYANTPARTWLATLGWQAGGPLPAAVHTLAADVLGQKRIIDAEISNPAGHTFWFSAAQPPGEDYVNLYGRDTTERRRAEEALRESESFYRQTLESIPGMVFTTRPDGYCDYQSQQWVDYTGVPMSEHLGDGWNKLLHPEDRPRAFAAWRAAVEGRAPYDLEYRVRRHDGAYEWFRVIGRPIHDVAGRIVRWFGVAVNIEELKRSEDRIRQQNTTLEAMNRIFAEALLYDPEEELGRRCLAIAEQVTESKFGFIGEINAEGRLDDIAISDPGWEACRMDHPTGHRKPPVGCKIHGIYGRVLLDGRGFFTNDPASHPDSIGTPEGHPPLKAFLGVPLKHDSKTIGMIAVGNREGGYRPQDLECLEAVAVAVVQVLMRKRAERAVREGQERLRQAQKMESIGVLAGGIAHDFNNLLTSILGNASLLQMDGAAGNGQQLQAIIESSEKAAALTRQILAYAGKGQFQITDFDVSRLVRSLADLLRVSIPKNIDLELDMPRNLPAVRGDSSQIQQVVMNLVINAAEAIEGRSDGSVCISAGIRDFDVVTASRVGSGIAPGRYISITVRDNGCGMDEQTRSKIFDPFFTTKFTGRGLGLAAVHGILRSHKGAITVESSPGQGSTFTVYLPCREERPAAWGPKKATPAGLRGATVLVVDDEEPVRAFTKAALERLGHTVLLADNGRQALDLLASRDDVELVLLDIIMPVVGGVEAFSEMGRKWPNLAVLIASGYNRQEACRLGMPPEVPFLEKPYTVQMLAAAVERVLKARSLH